MGDSVNGLEVRNLVVRFGGLTAVNGQTLTAPRGRITGLIGPNGAGKTTTFNAVTGVVTPSEGQVLLFGQDITRLSTQARAQRGLGRTFQRMELFETMTVRENVAMGKEASYAGRNPLSHLAARPSDKKALRATAEAAMELCDIAHLADQRPLNLSTGQRRLVELARVTAGDFRVLLLDEPSSGLDGTETERFGEIITSLVRERDIGILIVEHDMALVMSTCDYIHVLDFGKPIFEGTPKQVQQSELVRKAYLGSDAPELVS